MENLTGEQISNNFLYTDLIFFKKFTGNETAFFNASGLKLGHFVIFDTPAFSF